MDSTGRVKLILRPISQIRQRKGLEVGGDVQQFHAQNVLRRIIKYMPYQTGATIKLTVAASPVQGRYLVSNVPYGKYLYHGKAMEGAAPKKVTSRDLVYTVTKNPQAGPFWDRRLVAAEGAALQEDLQRYIRRKAGRA